MPARDLFHDAVREGLEKEGWTITADPYVIRIEGVTYDIDLGANKVLAANKGTEKIAVEIKTFIGPSFVNKFHEAMGQFVNYLVGLEEQEPERELFLAVPASTYHKFFQQKIIQKTIERYEVRLIIYDPSKNSIVEWKK